MYLNTYVWAHIFWSETRVYMALLMGAAMAVIMLSFAALEGEVDAPVPPSMQQQEEPVPPGPVSVDEALARPVIATLDAEA